MDDAKEGAPEWKNRERVLVLCSRGTSYRDRHLMNDFKMLMPHTKAESKMDKKHSVTLLNEMCEMKNCTKCVYFESKKKKDLYLWLSNVPRGPSVKFLVHNVHTMLELKLSGNCLKGSRPILSFSPQFESSPHWSLIKELLTQTFSTPNKHPRSQPFVDHVFAFAVQDDRVWFRNFQIVQEGGQLEEIGPRLVLEPIRIFEGSFCGLVLYENPSYVSPNEARRKAKGTSSGKYASRVMAKKSLDVRREEEKVTFPSDPTDDVFNTAGPNTETDTVTALKRKIESKRGASKKRKRRKTGKDKA